MIRTPRDVADAATTRFSTFTDEEPHLIPTGMGPLDDLIGGMSPQMVGLLVMARGVGKSSVALTAGYHSPVKTGIVSLEDPEAEVGIRMLSLKSGVNGLAIRRKLLDEDELRRVRKAREELEGEDGLLYAFAVGGGVSAMSDCIDQLGEAGCEFIWVDYAQKPRGHAEARKDEVATTFYTAAGRIARYNAAGIILSQITDVLETKRVRITQVRDSKDLLNECRIGVAGWRDPDDNNIVHFCLDKSMVGGDGFQWMYRRDASGTLREWTAEDDFAGEY